MAGDIHFDRRLYWTDSSNPPAGQYDWKAVMIHEIGHALGLGYSNDPESVMFPYIQLRKDGAPKYTLNISDAEGIRRAYRGG